MFHSITNSSAARPKKPRAMAKAIFGGNSRQRGGRPTSAEILKTMKVTFKGDRMVTELNDGKRTVREEVTVELDGAKTPKQLTLKDARRNGTYLGIYSLDGDTLKICYDDRERPVAFASSEGTSVVLAVLKRKR